MTTLLVAAATLPALVIGNGLDNCRTIADNRERLACYDALAGNTPQVQDPPATISAESLFGRDAAQTSAVLQQQTGITPPQILDAEISSVETRPDGKLRLTPGVLYPLLKHLEDEELVSSTWEEVRADDSAPEDSGRKRKWYRLSAKGRKRLAKRVASHRAWRSIIDAFIPGGHKPEEASS